MKLMCELCSFFYFMEGSDASTREGLNERGNGGGYSKDSSCTRNREGDSHFDR